MRRIAEFVLHHRRLVLVSWLVVVVAGIALTGRTNSRLVIDFSLPGQPGTETANQIDSEFHSGGKTAPYVVTITMPASQAVSGQETAIGQAFAAVQQQVPQTRVVDEANTGDKAFRTKDDRTAYALVFYRFLHDPTAKLPTADIKAALTSAAPAGATVGVTGEDALAVGDSGGGGFGVFAEVLIGALGALAVLAFVFASFLALLPLVIAAAAILTTFILLLPLTYLTDVSFIVEFLVALIGLGVAIDYSLILVTRWREERDRGRDNHEAVVVAMETAGHAVMFSGITVAIGLLSLVVLPVPFMRSIGLGGALIPLASVLTTLTLTPAILGGIGPRADWPKIRHENRAGRSWTRWAQAMVRRRFIAAGVAMLALGLLVVSFFGIKIGLASSDSLAKNGAANTTFQELKNGGVTTGVLTPMEVLVDTPRAGSVATALGKVAGVDRAVVATGTAQTAAGHSIVVVIPKAETVNSTSVGPVRQVKAAVASLPGVVGVAGIGADQIDFLKAVYGNFPLMLTIIALLTFVLLARAFRSVLLPIKAVVLNLITLGATLGFMVLFWQDGYGSNAVFGVHATGAVTFWIPLMVFAFLFGLSMDYEVFILSRIREEYDRTGNTDEAVVEGIGRTGRLVTSAALILFLAFLALATGPGTDLKTFASALGFGILLDATIVRSVLVPALVSLFGGWNWWLPDWAARVLRVAPSHPPVATADVAVPEPRDATSPSHVPE
ncbi:MMPL family transporter [Pseudofrankia sp. DC12]|uniref:MMPL family transporter n=1 Tax=Pseudofrankia sp. DC12 TaxID=683315 RepID=UPI0005F7F9F7|nr:MMPL family transporter [Pseudofrankia sp. DC12]